jgi:hypothetical protein
MILVGDVKVVLKSGRPAEAGGGPPSGLGQGLGLPRPCVFFRDMHVSKKGGSGQHRALARPPVRPGASSYFHLLTCFYDSNRICSDVINKKIDFTFNHYCSRVRPADG